MPGTESALSRPLRVAFLIYRGNPHCGGQGVYSRHLTRELSDLGHEVTMFAGLPWPVADAPVTLEKVESLDLYRREHPFRVPWPYEFNTIEDLQEFAIMCSAGFPEPYAFSRRVYKRLRDRRSEFDIVHDNQCLGRGLLGFLRDGWPLVHTLHHPITVDRDLELAHASSPWRKLTLRRWYGFLGMQMDVARVLPRHLTVSENSKKDIVAQMGVNPDTLHIVPVGVDQKQFRPMPHIARVPGRLMTTASADVPLKGLSYLIEALAKVRTEREDAHLVVIGQPRLKSAVPAQIERLGLQGAIEFVSGVSDERIVELYAEAEIAVVPSLYEGFSLPAVEAMACGLPLVTTTGGALPEVVGPNGDSAMTVPPADPGALAQQIVTVLNDDALRARLGEHGRHRVLDRFTWRRTAEGTAEHYYLELEAHERRMRDKGDRVMLTVDFDRLGLVRGERLLDLGAGGGRHAFEAMRRGAVVTALDYSAADLKDATGVAGAMLAANEVTLDQWAGAVNADALDLPFADAMFDRVIVSEVLEHIWDDERALAEIARVLRPGGRMAATVPTRWPERVAWAINWHYHDTPGGHVRIYRQHELETKIERAGFFLRGSHHAHAFHSPYWWLKCAYGLDNTEAAPVKRYHDFLCMLIERNPRWAELGERALNPVLGKSVVLYGEKVSPSFAKWGKRSLA